jgi:two-component system, NarL family, nitrate/nitrite response regulator NarL
MATRERVPPRRQTIGPLTKLRSRHAAPDSPDETNTGGALSFAVPEDTTRFADKRLVVLEAGAMSAATRSTRVLVADDHPVYLDGLAAAIQRAEDLELVATCRNGEEALNRIREDPPDVAVLDLRMPRLGAQAVLAELAEAGSPPCPVLVLSVHVDGEDVHECISLGAAGYIAKDADRSEICDAIRSVADGRTVLSDDAITSMASELQQRRTVQQGLLTDREGEVLSLLATGASAPDIATQLHLSAATVKTHLHNLYAKLGVSDRAAAVAEGMRRGLIS